MKRHAKRIAAGVQHLKASDPVMRELIPTCPPLTSLRLKTNRFASLAEAILSQQISIHAARSVRARLDELAGPGGVTAETIAQRTTEQLRSVGISRPKVAYLKDLAERVLSGEVRLDRLGRLKDENVISELILIKGIGVWTAQMFLIFSLGRLDVLPYDDFGVRAAIARLYGLDEPPDKKAALGIAEPWRPYATIASWYCWRSHEREGRKSGGT